MSAPDTLTAEKRITPVALTDVMDALNNFGRDGVMTMDFIGWMLDSDPDFCPPRWSLDLTTQEMRDEIDGRLLELASGGV